MKWFNAVLRYGLILMIVIAIAVAYVYRQQLFPAFFVPHQVNKNDHSMRTANNDKQINSATSNTPGNEQMITAEQSREYGSQSISSPEKQTATPKQSAVVEIEQDRPAELMSNKPPAGFETSNADEMTASHQERQSSQSMSGPAKSPAISSNQTAPQPLEATGQNGESSQTVANGKENNATQQQPYLELLDAGRQAYWQGQFEQAKESYRQAKELQPDNPDIYGELGNVYYSQGEWEEAGENFYQAAIRLIKHNRPERAHYLLSVISGLKKERAVELQQQLNEIQQRRYMRK